MINVRFLICILLSLGVIACHKQSKEELFSQGLKEMQAGNPKGAIVYYLNALEMDPTFVDARKNLAASYLAIGKLDKSEAELTTIIRQAPADAVATLTLAQIYNHTERTAKAIDLAEKFLAAHGDDHRALEVLGEGYRIQGDYDKASDYYLRALRLKPAQVSAKLGLAKVYQIRGDAEKAKQLLNEVISADPSQKSAYFALVNIESNLGNGAKALETLNRYLKVVPDDIAALYWAGMLLVNNNALAEAEAIATKLLTEHPDHPGGRQIKGLIYYNRGDYPAAIVELKQQLKGHGDIIGQHFLGLAYVQTNQPELAINHFRKVLELDPEHLQSRLQIASVLLRQKRFDECLSEIAKVRQVEPNNAEAYYVMGNAYMGKGNYDRAMEALDQAIVLKPTLVDAQVKKGLFTLMEGKSENAEAELAKAIVAAPRVTNNRLLLATLQLNQQKYAAALKTLRQGLINGPEDSLLYNYMAVASFALGNQKQAVEYLQKAKQSRPDFLAPYLNLAQYYFATGDQGKALAEYQALLQRAPGNIRALLGIAGLYEVSGDDTAAVAAYQKAADTGEADGYLALSGYWQRRNDQAKAMAVIEQAYAKHAGDPRILELRGRLAMALGQSEVANTSLLALEERQEGRGLPLLIEYSLLTGQGERARQMADEVITKKPDKAHGYTLLAFVLNYLKQYGQAEAVLIKGVSRATDNPMQIKISLADFYVSTGKTVKAKGLLDELRKRYPRSSEVLFALGNYHDSTGDKAQAMTIYQATLVEDPQHFAALNNLAYLYATANTRLDEALDMALRAFRANPNRPELMDTLGYILVKKGQSDKAVNLLEKAVAVLPQSPEVKLHLGQAYLAQGQAAKAKAVLQPVADTAPAPLANEARKLLASGSR